MLIWEDPARPLLSYCATHVLGADTPAPAPVMITEELHFAHSTCTSMVRGELEDRHGRQKIVVKVWRGAHMAMAFREKFVRQLSKELDNWKLLCHANIAPFLGVTTGFGHLPSLVLPFYTDGNIMDYLTRNPEANILQLLCGAAAGLAYMHDLTPPIVHGGVRGSNILITPTGTACLTDISLCNMPHSSDLTYASGELQGTRWMAPEVIDPGPDATWGGGGDGDGDGAHYATRESDVYSLGMTILEVYTGRVPFAHRRLHAGVIFDVIQGIRPPRPVPAQCRGMTDSVWEVVEGCWKQAPAQRLRAGAVAAWLHLLAQIERVGRAVEAKSAASWSPDE